MDELIEKIENVLDERNMVILYSIYKALWCKIYLTKLLTKCSLTNLL